MTEPETDKPDAEPEANMESDDNAVIRSLEQSLRIARPLTAAGAAPDALLITMTIAALMPVIQATMSFVLASGNSYRQVQAADAALSAASVPLLSESARRILSPTPRAAAPVSQAVTRGETQNYPQPQPLAVT